MRSVRAALLLLAAAAGPAMAAEDRPASLPTRDVDVTYRSEQAGQVLEQRSRFAVTEGRMRLDTPTPGVYVIVDYRAHTLAMVSDADKGVLDTAAPAGGLPGTAGSASYTRRNDDVVAGVPCTEWETRDRQGIPAIACFTADGVMLRARRGDLVLAVATRVAYGPMDPALFRVPAAYNHVSKPAAP